MSKLNLYHKENDPLLIAYLKIVKNGAITPDIPIDITSKKGSTLLHLATNFRDSNMILYLIHLKIDINK